MCVNLNQCYCTCATRLRVVQFKDWSPGRETCNHTAAVSQCHVSLQKTQHRRMYQRKSPQKLNSVTFQSVYASSMLLTELSVSCRLSVPPLACACRGYVSSVGCVFVTLTLAPPTGVNRSDRTSTSSYSTGMLHTHADPSNCDIHENDLLLKTPVSASTELLLDDEELL